MATPSQVNCMMGLRVPAHSVHIRRAIARVPAIQSSGVPMIRALASLFLLATFGAASFAADAAPGPWRPLLDAKLSNFDVYLSYHGKDILDVIRGKADIKPIGLNPAGQNVFAVVEQGGKPVLRITGES